MPAMDRGLLGKPGKIGNPPEYETNQYNLIDAYISSVYLKKKLKTNIKVQKEGGSIDWDEEFLVRIDLHHIHQLFSSLVNSLSWQANWS